MCLLGYSNVVSLDGDHVEYSRTILREFNIDLNELAANTPKIIGNPAKFRLMFRAPEGVELTHRTVMWPKQENPRERFAVFELRAGPVSDALPPTIHPETKQPYRWAIPPTNGFPPLPKTLLDIWSDWGNTEKKARALCPWAETEVETNTYNISICSRPHTGPSVIDKFNKAHDIAAILEEHGYQRKGKRFTKPGSHHSPGLKLLDSGKLFSHHAGDVLGGGHARDAFDCWMLLAHGGDIRAATKAAAQLLGLNRKERQP